MRRPAGLLTALAAAAVLAACGAGSGGSSGAGRSTSAAGGGGSGPASAAGGGGSSSATKAPDPCTLISTADLRSAYGVTFGEGTTSDAGAAAQRGFRSCTWSDAAGTSSFILQTVASGGPLGESASDLFDQSKDLYPGATDGGVGDKSVLLADDGGFLAVKGDVFVQGNPIVFGAAKPAGATTTVLRTVVGKLG